MSGDAQPRKRKDKKKKKEDSVEEEFFVPLKHSTDEVIHVQKDIICGGNVVTKLIFFGLMATIGVMVGFILLEYRGSTDEETSSAVDSPWSVTFHDWVDVADIGHEKHGDGETSAEEKEEDKSPSEEELFPEAREALRREAEEIESKTKEDKEEFSEQIEENIDSGKEIDGKEGDENEETEGTGGEDEIAPSTENIGVPSERHEPITETPVVVSAPVKTESVPHLEPLPQLDPEPKLPDEVATEELSADEESPVEEGSPVEEEEEEEVEEEQEDEDLEIDQQKFRDLLAKYGQETPESSDVEHTDEERVDYSEGEESPADDEGVEQEAVSEDEAGSEDDLKEWTGIKKSDIQVETDSEDEEVEEESEDESPSPPPPPQPSRKKGGQRDMDEDYGNALITSEEDWAIREELDQADQEFNYEKARTLYRALLSKHPDSPRARYGLARTFDRQAEHERSNVMLDLAITGYKDALEAPNITDILFIQIASRLIDRLRFRGHHMKAIPIHNVLIQKFNSTPEYRTDLAITYLMIRRCSIGSERITTLLESRSVCSSTLWPDSEITR